MDPGLQAVLGMSVAYLASGLGMLFAWLGYRKQRQQAQSEEHRKESNSG